MSNDPEWKDYEYRELQAACKERGLSAKGNRETLVNRLVDYDLGNEPDSPPAPESKPERYAGLRATDPNPDNPNWDMAGRWIRR